MKKWEIISKEKIEDSKLKIDDLLTLLLENRGLKNKKDIDAFLHPNLESVTTKSVGIDQKQLQKALKRIEKAVSNKEQIIVFGDYDVDGITGSSILWETLYALGATVTPYIPDRKDEGYGLSIKGIKNLESRIKDIKLIITVDNGIVANEAVAFANELGIDVIITDHHTVSETLPDAYAIVHTTNLCGAGVAYLLSKEIAASPLAPRNDSLEDTHLELAALGTVADLVPLTGANRTIVFEGLKELQKTKRVGLIALFRQAKVDQEAIGVYEIGYIIGPRLNASGRIDSAMDSLRLLCTNNKERAAELAGKLELVNRERQQLLKEAVEHAVLGIRDEGLGTRKILIVGHESYEEGVIGLVAGRLVEAFYRPAIVLSLKEKVSKASVRSVSGFNIIEFLRLHKEHFVNVGGHPMAAGFTVETEKIALLQKALEEKAEGLLTEELLTRSLKIDCELPFELLTKKLYDSIQKLAPFGMANPEPVFATRDVTVDGFRVIGKEGNHLKLVLRQKEKAFDAIAFGMGELGMSLTISDKIDVAYCLDENTWNGETKLQLKVRDIKIN
jgi:single-stranded-DNA-specific exonuclease